MKIGVLDYENCNSNSVYFSLINLGYNCKKIDDGEELLKLDKLIIPGNSNAKSAINFLKKNQLEEKILNFLEKKMVIRICLGAQIFCKELKEGHCSGLEYLDADVLPLNSIRNDFKINVGWKKISSKINEKNFNNEYYFCHTFYMKFRKKTDFVISQTSEKIPSIVIKKNLVGFQFHPEKSQSQGLKILSHHLDL